MKEIPILFSTPMVRAILEGRKTQTRRILKPQPQQKIMGGDAFNAMKSLGVSDDPLGWTWKGTRFMPWPKFLEDHSCPYGKVGDLLWVRETFEIYQGGYNYKAGKYGLLGEKWKPSIFMPKEATRIWLKVIGIRVERLHGISEKEAQAEGMEQLPFDTYYKQPFRRIWVKINGEENWDKNPWVWVIEFRKLNSEQKPEECDARKAK